jgi:hypothetical protein
MSAQSLPGSALTEADFQKLEAAFIDREIAEAAGLRRVSDAEAREILCLNGRRGNFAGILFRYADPETGDTVAFRLRRDEPDLEQKDGTVVEKAKYMCAPGQGNHLYFPPYIPAKWLNDSSIPVVMVEGEKKALALLHILLQLLRVSAERVPFIPIGLSGVWSWRGRVGKQVTASGSRTDVKGTIADLQKLAMIGRKITILFDSNVATKIEVQQARRQFSGWFNSQGARVYIATLPIEAGVNGPDDAAAKYGPEFVLELLRKATPLESPEAPRVLTSHEEGIVREQPYRGFLREYVNYASGRLPQVPSEYHELVGLVLAGGILGGKISTSTGLRPNIAGVIVAFQGGGKSYSTVVARNLISPIEKAERRSYDAELRQVRQAAREAVGEGEDATDPKERLEELERRGPPVVVIATQASVEGLLEALSCHQDGIADYDEFSAFLKDCRRDHMRSARENLIKALDGRSIRYRRTRGQSVEVEDPALSMWGTINVESLRAAASDEDLFGGLFSRILFCAPDYDFWIPVPQEGDSKLAEALVAQLRFWRSLEKATVQFDRGTIDRATEYGYSIAPYSKGERVHLTEPEDEVASIAYVRYPAHVQKVAMILAAGEKLPPDADLIVVETRHIILAINIVERFRRQAVRILRHVEGSDPVTRDADKLVGKITRTPGRERSYYQRLMRWNAKRFAVALAEIEANRRALKLIEKSTAGRVRTLYFPSDRH